MAILYFPLSFIDLKAWFKVTKPDYCCYKMGMGRFQRSLLPPWGDAWGAGSQAILQRLRGRRHSQIASRSHRVHYRSVSHKSNPPHTPYSTFGFWTLLFNLLSLWFCFYFWFFFRFGFYFLLLEFRAWFRRKIIFWLWSNKHNSILIIFMLIY